jgi:hypothetical protein
MSSIQNSPCYGLTPSWVDPFFFFFSSYAYSDSLSPSHEGFQPWWGPLDGFWHFNGYRGYSFYVWEHGEHENMQAYNSMAREVDSAIKAQFDSVLTEILKE